MSSDVATKVVENGYKANFKNINRYLDSDMQAVVYELNSNVEQRLDRVSDNKLLLFELCNIIKTATGADGLSLYFVGDCSNSLCLFTPIGFTDQKQRPVSAAPYGIAVASYVAKFKKTLLVQDLVEDNRFPKETWLDSTPPIQSVLCLPIVTTSNELIGVLELHRQRGRNPFDSEQQQIATANLAWALVAIHQVQ
ncbi:hypothetical protein scyTo_0018156, partial [Scyliorhinus torazame]|nr:hypothetical protein [Scyliorhinus torazame]